MELCEIADIHHHFPGIDGPKGNTLQVEESFRLRRNSQDDMPIISRESFLFRVNAINLVIEMLLEEPQQTTQHKKREWDAKSVMTYDEWQITQQVYS